MRINREAARILKERIPSHIIIIRAIRSDYAKRDLAASLNRMSFRFRDIAM